MDDIPVPIPSRPTRFMDRLWEFIRFHQMRRPEEMGAAEVDKWLGYLANRRSVSINTQKTAFNSVVFLYKQFLGMELGGLQFDKTSKGRRLPVVFTHEEAIAAFTIGSAAVSNHLLIVVGKHCWSRSRSWRRVPTIPMVGLVWAHIPVRRRRSDRERTHYVNTKTPEGSHGPCEVHTTAPGSRSAQG